MALHFKKCHGLGNDYLVIDPNMYDVEMTEANIRLICDRNFGIGSDGILYGPQFEGETQTPMLRIFNPDGSEAEKSGNGLRIFAKYLFENKYVKSKSFKIKDARRHRGRPSSGQYRQSNPDQHGESDIP